MGGARTWLVANFKAKTRAVFGQLCPPGSESNAYYRQMASYWDMVASFITAGVLNAELCFANNREMLVCWIRVKPIIGEVRAAFGDSNYLGNLEKAVAAFVEWLNKTSGAGAYEAFAKRVGG